MLDNSNINEYEKIANSAMDKINEIVNNRNVELPKEDKPEEKRKNLKKTVTHMIFRSLMIIVVQ